MGGLRRWNLESGEETHFAGGDASELFFTPDGSWLTGVYPISPAEAQVWSLRWPNGEEPHGEMLKWDPPANIKWWTRLGGALAPNGTTIATASFDGAARLWSVPELRASGRLLGGHRELADIDYIGSGGNILTGDLDGVLRIYNSNDDTPKLALSGTGGPAVAVAALNTKIIALIEHTEHYDQTGTLLSWREHHQSPLPIPQSDSLLRDAVESEAGSVIVQAKPVPPVPVLAPTSVEPSAFPESEAELRGALEGLWTTDPAESIERLTAKASLHGLVVTRTLISAKSKRIVAALGSATAPAGADSWLLCIDLSDLVVKNAHRLHGGVISMVFDRNETRVGLGMFRGQAAVWTLSAPPPLLFGEENTEAFAVVAFTPAGDGLAHSVVGGMDIEPLVPGLFRRSLVVQDRRAVSALAFSPDGSVAVAAFRDSAELQFWAVDSGKQLGRIRTCNGPRELAVSGDGARVAVLCGENSTAPATVSLHGGYVPIESNTAAKLTNFQPVGAELIALTAEAMIGVAEADTRLPRPKDAALEELWGIMARRDKLAMQFWRNGFPSHPMAKFADDWLEISVVSASPLAKQAP